MKLSSCLAIAIVAAAAGVGRANPSAPEAAGNPLATPWSRPRATYLVAADLPRYENHVARAAPGFSNVIYLNNCKPAGCEVRPGNENSTATPPTSIVPDIASIVQPFAYSDAIWQQVVECVRKTYSPFQVEITDVRPTSGDYHMAIVAGEPQDVQQDAGVGGVSPFSCGYIPNAVSYSFANVYGPDVDDICWTVAQETAHSWGLDHKFDNRDPMTYLASGPTRKVFQNEAGSCGELSARSCQCGGSQMNAFAEILETFGAAPLTPPVVGITAPRDGDSVADRFPIRADITDDLQVSKAELRIDGTLVSTLTKFPYVWNAPETVGQGRHRVKVTGYDTAGTTSEVEIEVAIGRVCGKPSECTRAGDTCVDGRCVPGSGVDGGLGTTCADNAGCVSRQCAADSEGNRYCVETCEPEADGCPSGYSCLPNGAAGVCWPTGDGGGCSTGGAPQGFGLAGAAALLALRRRRRQPR